MIRYYLASPLAKIDLTFKRATSGSSGFDLHANTGVERQIAPGRRATFMTGLYLGMPEGVEAHVRPRSGLARDWGIAAVFGSIDADYRGEIGVTLMNHGHDPFVIHPGYRIAQLVFAPVMWVGEREVDGQPTTFLSSFHELVKVASVEELGMTDRGRSGFGSSGL